MRNLNRPDVAPFDVKEGWAWRGRWARNWLVVAAVTVGMVDGCGLPHLAWTYHCHHPPCSLQRAYRATYVGPLGTHEIRSDQFGPGMTAIKWLPVEPPLHRRLLAWGTATIDHLGGRVSALLSAPPSEPWDAPL